MLEEILKTPRGEKVVQGEARHSSRGGEPITGAKIKQAEEKIQRMLEAAATQKGRQKFSEVYPKLEGEGGAGAEGDDDTGGGGGGSSGAQPVPPPKMKRYVHSVVQATKGSTAFAGASSGGGAATATAGATARSDSSSGGSSSSSGKKSSSSQSDVLLANSLVYAKWYGPEREKYPDWCVLYSCFC
jgi:hypothetical protein